MTREQRRQVWNDALAAFNADPTDDNLAYLNAVRDANLADIMTPVVAECMAKQTDE